nr:MAG TPA: hypothetical protein [Caudoviricetes sp.]
MNNLLDREHLLRQVLFIIKIFQQRKEGKKHGKRGRFRINYRTTGTKRRNRSNRPTGTNRTAG